MSLPDAAVATGSVSDGTEEKTLITVGDAVLALNKYCQEKASTVTIGKRDREFFEGYATCNHEDYNFEAMAYEKLKKNSGLLFDIGINFSDVIVPANKPKSTKMVPEDCLLKTLTPDIYNGINHDKAARLVLEKFSVLKFYESGKTYLYDDGIYVEGGSEKLKAELYDLFDGYINDKGQSIIDPTSVNKILDKVFSKNTRQIRDLDEYRNYLCLENGLFNLGTKELIPHDPNIIKLGKANVIYDPEAKCPKFLEYLREYLEDEFHLAMQELFGYSMYYGFHIHRAFMFYGPPRTGKGTIIRVMEKLVGPTNLSNISLHQLCSDKFASAKLFGKTLNTRGDLPRQMLEEFGIFMEVTGGDSISAQDKGKPLFSFKNIAKLVFSTNTLPALKKDSKEYYTRWLIFPFNKSFLGEENQGIEDSITTPEEMSGVLNWALEGLERLLDNGKFSYAMEADRFYQRIAQPITAFLEDWCKPSIRGFVTKDDMWKAFIYYAEAHGLPPTSSKKKFGTYIMDQMIIPVEESRRRVKIDGRNYDPEVWVGIELTEEAKRRIESAKEEERLREEYEPEEDFFD